MYSKEVVSAMRDFFIAVCETTKSRKDGSINCTTCKIAKDCASVSGHPPRYMNDDKIVELWEVTDFKGKPSIDMLLAGDYEVIIKAFKDVKKPKVKAQSRVRKPKAVKVEAV